jgi:hypothetical protein
MINEQNLFPCFLNCILSAQNINYKYFNTPLMTLKCRAYMHETDRLPTEHTCGSNRLILQLQFNVLVNIGLICDFRWETSYNFVFNIS